MTRTSYSAPARRPGCASLYLKGTSVYLYHGKSAVLVGKWPGEDCQPRLVITSNIRFNSSSDPNSISIRPPDPRLLIRTFVPRAKRIRSSAARVCTSEPGAGVAAAEVARGLGDDSFFTSASVSRTDR